MYKVIYSKRAVRDIEKLKRSNLSEKARSIIFTLMKNPYSQPCEKLQGRLKGFFSKRINKQHRIVYQVFEDEKLVVVYKMWTHYE